MLSRPSVMWVVLLAVLVCVASCKPEQGPKVREPETGKKGAGPGKKGEEAVKESMPLLGDTDLVYEVVAAEGEVSDEMIDEARAALKQAAEPFGIEDQQVLVIKIGKKIDVRVPTVDDAKLKEIKDVLGARNGDGWTLELTSEKKTERD
ncbi:MAG: hypothetical protein ACOC8E_02050 [Planctomycetota bacterium]